MVAAKVNQPMSYDEFIEFALRPENSEREFEFIDGEIIEKMPGRTTNSVISMIIGGNVYAFCRDHSLSFYVTGEAGAYRILGRVIVPDFAYRLTALIGDYPDPVPPSWAVEIISPTDKAGDIRTKRNIYIEAGILLWEMYPLLHQVDVYAPGQPMRTVGIDGVLDGGDVLPGFTLPLKDLFPESA